MPFVDSGMGVYNVDGSLSGQSALPPAPSTAGPGPAGASPSSTVSRASARRTSRPPNLTRSTHRRPAAGRRPDRAAAAGLLRGYVGRVLRARQGRRAELRPHHNARVHRRGQQLRTRDRCRHRRLRRHLRPGPRRGGRPAHRSAGPGRVGVRQPVAPTSLGRPARELRPSKFGQCD